MVQQRQLHTDDVQIAISGVSCHKYRFCRDKHVFVSTNASLWRQNTSFIATKVCLPRKTSVATKLYLSRKNIFVVTKVLSRQIIFCRDKHVFVAIMILLSRKNTCFVAFVVTNIFCRDKTCQINKNMPRQAYFYSNKTRLLSRQKRVCRDKTFLATKMILVAPANVSVTSGSLLREMLASAESFNHSEVLTSTCLTAGREDKTTDMWREGKRHSHRSPDL